MKATLKPLLVLLLPALYSSCSDKVEDTYIVNEPVYMSYEDLRNSFKVAKGEEIRQPGKIYFKDDYVFVNEYQKGIHIIDNSNPGSPEVVSFLEIPGNVDLAIRENILYADSYVDLVAIDISNLNEIKEVNRVENAFPYILPFNDYGLVEGVDETKGVVVAWKETEKTVVANNNMFRYDYYLAYDDFAVLNASGKVSGESGSATGTGGSMARFTLYDSYLYTVDQSVLRLFDVSKPENPLQVRELGIGWNIETIFPYQGKLFIGSTTGMHIYSLNDPLNPVFISTYRHATSCDPVVVQGDYAYVTLRAGNLCGDTESQLDVIDVSNIYKPQLIKEYAMQEPYGLGIDGELLFVCDGDAGLKIYNASDPLKIDRNMVAIYKNINAYDVIPLGNILLMIGRDGLYQYDYSDPENIILLSVVPIEEL